MAESLKLLRMVQWALLFTILVYAVVGEIAGPHGKGVNPALSYVFTSVGVAVVGMIFVVRRTLVQRSAESLVSRPDDTLALNHWKVGYLITYSLCELVAIFGFVLRFLGFTLQQSLPFYISGFVLLFFFGPRQPTAPNEQPPGGEHVHQ